MESTKIDIDFSNRFEFYKTSDILLSNNEWKYFEDINTNELNDEEKDFFLSQRKTLIENYHYK